MCCLQLKCLLLCFVLICLLAPANIATSGRRSDLQPMHSPPLLRYPPHRWSHIISYFLLFFCLFVFFGEEAFILTFFLMDVFIGLNLLPLQYRWHKSRLRFMQYGAKIFPRLKIKLERYHFMTVTNSPILTLWWNFRCKPIYFYIAKTLGLL